MSQILIVDDDVEIREALTTLLLDHGYTVSTAANGREALAALRVARPCLILLDLMMPIMSGWEFLELLNADPVLRDIPVCVISAMPDRAPAGVARVLAKPLKLELLLGALADHC